MQLFSVNADCEEDQTNQAMCFCEFRTFNIQQRAETKCWCKYRHSLLIRPRHKSLWTGGSSKRSTTYYHLCSIVSNDCSLEINSVENCGSSHLQPAQFQCLAQSCRHGGWAKTPSNAPRPSKLKYETQWISGVLSIFIKWSSTAKTYSHPVEDFLATVLEWHNPCIGFERQHIQGLHIECSSL